MAVFSDNFNRANGAPGAPWVVTGGASIGSNRLVVPAGDTAIVVCDSADGDLQFTTAFGSGNEPRVRIRQQDATNYIEWNPSSSSGALRLATTATGVNNVVTFNTTLAANDVMKVTCAGTSIKCFKNGTLQGEATITNFATVKGFGVSSGNGAQIDDFSFTPAATGPVVPTIGQIWPRGNYKQGA